MNKVDKGWVLYLFSYNRPSFLENAVNSINRFLPWIDCVVVDDGSDHPQMDDVLIKVAAMPNWQVKIMPRNSGMYGGFYRNMAWALSDAVKSDYKYCYFFEDDEQVVWCPEGYREHIDNLFSKRKDAHQVQPLFFRRMKCYEDSVRYCPEVKAYRTNRGFNTTGIWNLDIVRKEADIKFFSHGDGLPMNSANWLEKGYRIYCDELPTVAVLPWVSSNSDASVSSNLYITNDKLMLRPLTENEKIFLKTKPPTLVAYQEYFELSKLNSRRPIWHQNNRLLDRYFELCAQTIDTENSLGESPVRVKLYENDDDLTPLQSHLDFKKKYYEKQQSEPSIKISQMRLFAYEHFKTLVKWWRYGRQFQRISFSSYLKYRELCRRLAKERKTVAIEFLE